MYLYVRELVGGIVVVVVIVVVVSIVEVFWAAP